MLVERTKLCSDHNPGTNSPALSTDSNDMDSEISFDAILPADPDEEVPDWTDIMPTLQLENPSTPAIRPLPPQPAGLPSTHPSEDAGPSAIQPSEDAGPSAILPSEDAGPSAIQPSEDAGPSTTQPSEDGRTPPNPPSITTAPLPSTQQLADRAAPSAQNPGSPLRNGRRRRKTTLSSDCDSVKDSYVKALHLVNNDHNVADAIKKTGLSRTAFYRYKYIAELEIVDRDYFSNLLASRPEMTKSSFAQVCKEALSEKGETTIQMRKEKLLL